LTTQSPRATGWEHFVPVRNEVLERQAVHMTTRQRLTFAAGRKALGWRHRMKSRSWKGVRLAMHL